MDYARQQRDPTRHLIGIAFVILVHVLVVYALLTGLARKAVEVIKKPLTATIIQEIKAPPPPPPPKKIVEAPKVPVPQQTYVPPPDVAPPTATPQAITIESTPVVPTQPYEIKPPPPVEAPPAPPPPKPAVRRGVTPIEREDPVYPRAAIKAGIEKGRVLARVAIDERGNVTDVTIVSAEPPRHFENSVREALMKWKFKPEGDKYVAEIEVVFTLKD